MTNPVAGVYVIIFPNNKRYIGESSDLKTRWNRYKWAASSKSNYAETNRLVTQKIRKYGIENIRFEILACGEEYKDIKYRLKEERHFIRKYNTANKRYGYNLTTGGEPGPRTPRRQKSKERIKRAKPIVLYDIKKDCATIYFGGAKAIGDDFGYSKDVMSHTVMRGSLFLDRYYLIPLRSDDINALIERLRVKKVENHNQPKKARSHSKNAYYKWLAAVERVYEIFNE